MVLVLRLETKMLTQVQIGEKWFAARIWGPCREGQSVPGGPQGRATGLICAHLYGEEGIRAQEAATATQMYPSPDIGNGGPSLSYALGFLAVYVRQARIRAVFDPSLGDDELDEGDEEDSDHGHA